MQGNECAMKNQSWMPIQFNILQYYLYQIYLIIIRLKSFKRSLDNQSGGKSEHQRAGCSITWSRGDAKESATENIPPVLILLLN